MFTEKTFTAGDGYCLRYRRFAPAIEPRARVVFIHGIQSHAGWYERSCDALCRRGFLVEFLDRRGSGAHAERRGDAPGFRRLLDDVAEFLRGEQGGGKPFLVGISWGGKIATALQRRHPDTTRGLLLLCPGLFPRVRPSMRDRLRIVWSRLVAPSRMFPIPLNDPELFTVNPEKREFIRSDPLALHEATARFMLESARLDGYLRFVPKYVRVPVLLMLAERDRIIDNERTRRYVDRFASTDRTVIEYPEAHHTLEFEPVFERFVGDLGDWLEKRS